MKKLLTLILALAMILALVSCGGSSSSSAPAATETKTEEKAEEAAPAEDAAPADSGETYNLSFSLAVSDDNFQGEAWTRWCDAVTEATDGRVTFTIYYNGTAIDASDEYQNLVAGIVDIADVHRYEKDGFIISQNWKSLTSGVPEDAVVDFSYRLYNEFPEIAAEYDGVKVLAQGFNGGTMYQLLTVDKEVRTPADMAGLTIWCEADWNGFVEKCGATPINTPFPEVYSSLQKHMYDGMMIPTETLKSCNFAEVCKYCVKLNLCYTSEPGHLMNLDTWNSLPADIQAAIDSCATGLEEDQRQGFKDVEAISMQWAEDTYGTVEVVLTDEQHDAFTALVQEANLEKAAELDAQGLPGSDIVNALAQWTAEWNG